MTANENQIVVYQPNETVRLDVRLENETVWLTQEQIANLFGTKRPAITKHLANIYKSGELEREGTCSILEHMGNDGKQSYRTMFYNLDAILSVGYRVNSRNATLFRRWATQVLKSQGRRILANLIWYNIHHEMTSGRMNNKATDCSQLARDILEWNVPEEVLAVLLKDRSTGRNLIWATDDYAARGKGFGANDEMQVAQIVDKDHPVIRPRVDKNAEEQRQRSVKRAEVFTPSWICNKQNNLVDAAWFGWKKPDSSPFNTEIAKFDPETEFGWKSTCGKNIKFPKGKTWQEYVKAPRLEVSCGEAPYLASRYDTVSGRIIPVCERIGLLDRKLRVITENVGTIDPQDWLYYAKRAVQSIYGFDWQGDNVLLARENVLFTVVESFNADFFGDESSCLNWTTKSLLEFAEIISWNIWQMDGIKYVVPMSCKPKVTKIPQLDGTFETHVEECPGCRMKGKRQHFGTYCKVMDWNAGEPVEFRAIAENGGGHGQ